MSRYSLRATPKKQELFEGMVHTPVRRRSARSTSKPSTDSDSIMGDSSSEAAETTESGPSRPRRRRRPIKREDDAEENVTLREDVGQEEEEERKDRELEVKKEAREEERRADKVKKIRAVDGYVPGQDPRVDQTGEFEFGGSLGALAMMIGFPLLMWYMWIGATYYGGHLPARDPGQSWSDFGRHLARIVYEGAFPSARAFGIYWAFFLFEMACYCTLPGVWAYGKPLPHEGGRQLRYFCNAYASLYFTAAVAAGLHFSGLFPLQTVLDEFGPLLSAAIASSYAVSLVQYVSAVARGRTHRMTGYPIYDFFMGAELNPRLFDLFDFKMFVEVRIPWYMLLCITAAAAARQYERYGRVAPEVIFLALAHYLYANACSKGEELIVTTWDIYYEKSGFMYTFWTMAGVPLSYCHCTLYLANHDPAEYRLPPGALAVLCVAYAFWYWVWDSANSQKNRFRASERGQLVFRRTFPQLPWQTLHDPRVLVTPEGYTILADGWYGLARKIHYTADAFFALSWAVVCGFRSPFPWFYPLFFTCMIIHRASRDIHKCRTKYGEQWKEYERLVPYLFIPYVF